MEDSFKISNLARVMSFFVIYCVCAFIAYAKRLSVECGYYKDIWRKIVIRLSVDILWFCRISMRFAELMNMIFFSMCIVFLEKWKKNRWHSKNNTQVSMENIDWNPKEVKERVKPQYYQFKKSIFLLSTSSRFHRAESNLVLILLDIHNKVKSGLIRVLPWQVTVTTSVQLIWAYSID